MTNEYPDVIPMISYEDGIAALEWLSHAFGFRERERMLSPDGTLVHAELEAGSGLIMLATATPDYQSPKRLQEQYAQARKWSAVPWVIDGVLVHVEDVEAHYERAKKAGAVLLSELEDGPPARRYRAEDLEGHRWMFMQRGQESSK